MPNNIAKLMAIVLFKVVMFLVMLLSVVKLSMWVNEVFYPDTFSLLFCLLGFFIIGLQIYYFLIDRMSARLSAKLNYISSKLFYKRKNKT